jgi:hypothetical protein
VKKKVVGHGGIYLLEIPGTWRGEEKDKRKEKNVDYNEFVNDLIQYLT